MKHKKKTKGINTKKIILKKVHRDWKNEEPEELITQCFFLWKVFAFCFCYLFSFCYSGCSETVFLCYFLLPFSLVSAERLMWNAINEAFVA